MQNDWRIRTVVVAFAAAMAATVFAQWPFSLPLLNAGVGQAKTHQAGKVSLSGDAVTAEAVFAQLRQAGANFVVSDSAMPLDRKLSLNLVDQDPETALKAVAKALGMTVTKEGDVLVLAQGNTPLTGMLDWERAFGDRLDVLKPFHDQEGSAETPFNFFLEKSGTSMPNLDDKAWNELFKDIPGVDSAILGAMLRGHALDLEGLAKSLTPEQKALHEKQGFLTPEDLTPEQRKMLGTLAGSKGDFEVTFAGAGTQFRLKNK